VPKPPGSRTSISPHGAVLEIAPEKVLQTGPCFPKEDDVGEIPIFFLAKKIKAGIAVETKDVW